MTLTKQDLSAIGQVIDDKLSGMCTDLSDRIVGVQDELRTGVNALRDGRHTDLVDVTDELRDEVTSLGQKLHTDVTDFGEALRRVVALIRDDLHDELALLEGRMRSKFDLLRSEVRDVRSELGVDIRIAQRANARRFNILRDELTTHGVPG